MGQLLTNNASALLVGAITSAATSLTIEAARADLFPVGNTTNHASPLNWFKATLEDVSGNIEIVHVGVRTSGSGVLSVLLRGQDGTTALNFAVGSVVELRVTAADIQNAINAPSNIPAGNIAATTVQAAINELDAEKAKAGANSDITSLTGLTTPLSIAQGGTGGTVGAPAGLPAGAVIHVAQSIAPTGFLKADGALVNRTTFAALFAAIGTTFGAGDGVTTFGVPDLRGEFVRGWDDARGADSGRAFGSTQAAAFASHGHAVNDPSHAHSYEKPNDSAGQSIWYGAGNYTGLSSPILANLGAATSAAITGITVAPAGGAETRPRNIALLACIKF